MAVYLKPNFGGDPDQLIVDELKPLFGLRKMGTHTLVLDKVVTKLDKHRDWYDPTTGVINAEPKPRRERYFMFQARINSETGEILDEPMLRTVPYQNWGSTLGEQGLEDLRRIYLFREVVYASDTCTSNVLLTGAGPMSVDEMVIKRVGETNRMITREAEKILFGKPLHSRKNTLVAMIHAGTPKQEDPQQLTQRMITVVRRLVPDGSYDWVVIQAINHANQLLTT